MAWEIVGIVVKKRHQQSSFLHKFLIILDDKIRNGVIVEVVRTSALHHRTYMEATSMNINGP